MFALIEILLKHKAGDHRSLGVRIFTSNGENLHIKSEYLNFSLQCHLMTNSESSPKVSSFFAIFIIINQENVKKSISVHHKH